MRPAMATEPRIPIQYKIAIKSAVILAVLTSPLWLSCLFLTDHSDFPFYSSMAMVPIAAMSNPAWTSVLRFMLTFAHQSIVNKRYPKTANKPLKAL